MTACELFESARNAPARIAELDRIMALGGDEGGGSSALVGHGSGIGNPTATRALARISRTEDAAAERSALMWALAECRAIVAGVRSGLSANHADVLEWSYLDGWDMFYVAQELGVSMATCYRLRAAALEWIDSIGLARAKALGSGAE